MTFWHLDSSQLYLPVCLYLVFIRRRIGDVRAYIVSFNVDMLNVQYIRKIKGADLNFDDDNVYSYTRY